MTCKMIDNTWMDGRSEEDLAEMWCELNRWGWPRGVPSDLNPSNHRGILMNQIERRVGKRACLNQWNGSRARARRGRSVTDKARATVDVIERISTLESEQRRDVIEALNTLIGSIRREMAEECAKIAHDKIKYFEGIDWFCNAASAAASIEQDIRARLAELEEPPCPTT